MDPDPRGQPPGTLLVAVEAGDGRAAVAVRLLAQGRDLLLLVTGGEAHVGAVALSGATAGTRGEPCEALLVAPGHKEGPLAAEGAALVAAATGRACVAVAGIHQDGATPGEIAEIVANVRRAYARLTARLRGEAGET